jgi:hypothetical protein
MLSEKVLEELSRITPLRESLVRLAWPNLSTEAKLDIVHAIQGNGPLKDTPHWLSRLALEDPAPVVRYWASRHAYFNNSGPEQYREEWKSFAASDEDKALYAKVATDDSLMVRLCADNGDTLSYTALTDASQLKRLTFLRNLAMPSLPPFIDWLDEALLQNIADDDLRDCAEEFFMHPCVARDIARTPQDFLDGFDAYQCGAAIKRGWTLLHRAGPKLRRALSYSLPTSLGLGTIAVDDLVAMPDEVLQIFPYRAASSEEIRMVIQIMHDYPERFSARVLDAVNRFDQYDEGEQSNTGELEAQRKRQAIDQQAATLDTVLELKQQLGVLCEQVEEVARVMSTRKSGFFG